jgi:aryl sulfotransferase
MSDLPQLEHVYQNHHMDSTRWNWFTPRDDDIVIATSYKAGTTFTQTIVGNLLFPDGNLPGAATFISPWVDMRVFPLEMVLGQLEAQTHRRFVKTHLPLDSLRFFENVKYICVSRDPRDVFMSLLNHWGNHTPEFYLMMNSVPGLVGEPFPEFVDDVKATWRTWITRSGFEWEIGGYPYWSHLSHALTYWRYRELPNLMMLHFNDLLADLDGEMRRVADFLEINVPAECWDDVVNRCKFETVKKDPAKVVGENIDFAFKGGADAFINKGTNGRWVGVLDDEDLSLYEEAMAKLPADYANWLENGNQAS